MWADWWGFKMESYDGIRENIALVHNAGACAIVHSDDPNGIQRLNQEAAKAMAAGKRAGIVIPPEVVWEWLSLNPAKGLQIDQADGQPRTRQDGRRRPVERRSAERLFAADHRVDRWGRHVRRRRSQGADRGPTSSWGSRVRETSSEARVPFCHPRLRGDDRSVVWCRR